MQINRIESQIVVLARETCFRPTLLTLLTRSGHRLPLSTAVLLSGGLLWCFIFPGGGYMKDRIEVGLSTHLTVSP